MSERKIERKYTMPTPKELFESFQVEFRKGKLPDSWYDPPSWTTFMLGIFNDIGQNYGYTQNEIKTEYLRLDQTWEIRHPGVSVLTFALEHENTSKVSDILDDELQKLLDVKALLKVLVFYPEVPVIPDNGQLTYPEIHEKICSTQIKHSDEKYVIMSGVYSKAGFLEVFACSLDSDGKAEDLGSIQVTYTSRTS
jgi:hypothetical protein